MNDRDQFSWNLGAGGGQIRVSLKEWDGWIIQEYIYIYMSFKLQRYGS